MNWQKQARQIVRAELVRRGVTYDQLATRLRAIGVDETERSIANKMSRGTFSFVFALQCLKAMGAKSVSLDLEPETGALEWPGSGVTSPGTTAV